MQKIKGLFDVLSVQFKKFYYKNAFIFTWWYFVWTCKGLFYKLGFKRGIL